MSKEDIQYQIQEQSYAINGPYHRRALKNPFGPSRLRYDIALKLIDKPSGNILDYGSGDAALATLMQDGGANVVIFDPSRTALKYATKADQRLLAIEGLTYLPFPKDTFDIVTMLETLEHIPDEEETLSLNEVSRVLMPGGELILSVPHSNLPVSHKHYRHYDSKTIIDKLTGIGFSITSIHTYKEFNSNINNPLIRKSLLAPYYMVDKFVRRLNGNVGLVETPEENATGIFVLARKGSK